MKIAYGTLKLSVGTLAVGVSAKGICYVGQAENIPAAIHKYYPDAEIVKEQNAIAAAADTLKRWLAGENVPLAIDTPGTAFQQQVWNALRRIPRGQTRTYTQIAKTIGKPKAVRAVGNACGANPVALLVPCHRVVASGGGLGGYAWGLPMKKQLLELEGACA